MRIFSHIVKLSVVSGLFLILILLMNKPLSAQSNIRLLPVNLLVEAKYSYGFLIPHHREMQIFNGHFPAFELNLSQATFGKNKWEYIYEYPVIGIAFWYSKLGKNPFLGDACALYPFINFPLTERKKGTLSFRLGLGLGYISKPFDRIENYKNIAIGSHINAAVNLMFEYSRKINERIFLSGAIGLTHFSNGSIKTPNYGINIPALSGGISYRLNRENPYQRSKDIPGLYKYEFDGKKFFELDLTAAAGLKNMDQEYGKKYEVFTLFGNALKQISYKSKIGLGFDLSYDASDVFILEKSSGKINNRLEIVRPGLNVAYELVMSRFSMVFNLGMYLSGKERSDGDVYEKLGFKLQITDKVFTSVTLKAHAARADYIGFGLGYKLKFMYY